MNTIVVNGKKITPTKIVCVGRNYVDHISELGNDIPSDMVVFNKPNSAIASTLKSFDGEPLHYEGEICFVYEKGCFSAVGFGLDLTKRSLQSELKAKGLPWERAKAFDGSVLLSEFSLLTDNILVDRLAIELTINDKLCQQGEVKLMMYKPSDILTKIQAFMTLEDGDVVMTGTPKGVGEIETGQKFEGKIMFEDKIVANALWIAE